MQAEIGGAAVVGSVSELLETAVSRQPFLDHGGFSGSTLERVTLADGRRLVLKHFSADIDYIMRATRDEGRAAYLYTAGILGPVANVLDDAILAVEPEGNGWVMAMRDVGDELVDLAVSTSRADSLRVLRAIEPLHRAYLGQQPQGMACLEDWYAFLTPRIGEQVRRPTVARSREQWAYLADRVPPDMGRVLSALADEPKLLCDELRRYPQTLIHGELKLENVGFTAGRVILIDWALATVAPAEAEFAYYLLSSAWRIDASPDQLLEDIRTVRGDDFEPRAMELALIGSMVQRGAILAHNAAGARPGRDPARANALLDWMIDRVSRALKEVWSPL